MAACHPALPWCDEHVFACMDRCPATRDTGRCLIAARHRFDHDNGLESWPTAERTDMESFAATRLALLDYVTSPHAYPLRDGHQDGFCRRCAAMYVAANIALSADEPRSAAEQQMWESIRHLDLTPRREQP